MLKTQIVTAQWSSHICFEICASQWSTEQYFDESELGFNTSVICICASLGIPSSQTQTTDLKSIMLELQTTEKQNRTKTVQRRGKMRVDKWVYMSLCDCVFTTVCWGMLLFVGYLTSQQRASLSHGWICTDSCMCCNTEKEVADKTYLSHPGTVYWHWANQS